MLFVLAFSFLSVQVEYFWNFKIHRVGKHIVIPQKLMLACICTCRYCSMLCGNVSVPYPFGIGSHKCYLPGFNLTCDTSYNPPRLMLGTLQVVDISLHNSTVRVINSNRVLDIYGGVASVNGIDFGIGHGDTVPYSLSTRNELIVIGCGVHAGLSSANNRAILSGCSSFCSSNESRADDARSSPSIDDNGEYCYGNGCCQARITMSRDGMPSEFWIDWMDSNSV